ncbi:hypothetical protein F441_12145 [Phytophthora nicotianae CJ01A1]|uniref:Uncharacterized protein n=1 Tax=Phytophthora nicotianae CJ01A1 TaxID=1317063 RepID=W2WQT6_PHYNI|nr:hypothetical protein F441_12145 [Phytophthora nicotianae CJ01A1]
MEWDGLEVPMRLRVNLASERYVYESPASVQAAKKRMVQILDTKYAKVNLDSCIPDHLDSNQQHALRKLLEFARHKQIPSSGYANMISHLKDKHPGYVEDYKSHQSRQAGLHRTFGFVNPTASNMYRWIEWVVARNMPLSEVDDPFTKGMSKLQPVCSKTLKRYMTLLVAAVEAKITAEMSGQYGYMYDASTFYLENYVDNIKHVEDAFDLIPKAAMHRRIEALLKKIYVSSRV